MEISKLNLISIVFTCLLTFFIWGVDSVKVPKDSRRECGMPGPRPIKSIINGKLAQPNHWPWAANIHQYFTNYFGDFEFLYCGGTLYDEYHVITAAHCIDERPIESLMIHLGDVDKYRADPGERVRRVAEAIMHEEYDVNTTDNDIAILRLVEPVKYSASIGPICLPDTEVHGGEHLIVVGWGQTQGTGSNSALNQVMVPVVPSETCNSEEWYDDNVTPNMFCAGYEQGQKDSCQGDSGGSAVRRVGGRYVLQGIVSWGDDCAKPKQPGVYTNVVNYVDWIREKTTRSKPKKSDFSFRTLMCNYMPKTAGACGH